MSERNRSRDVGRCLLAAAVVGVVVAGTAYLCAYYDQRDHPNYLAAEEYTRLILDKLEEAIEKHRKATGRLPASLTELEKVKEQQFRVDADGWVVDGWRHPYQYRAEGDGFVLYSFGRDGQPGGEGRDADIYPTSAGRSRESPTLRQFTFDLPTEGVQWTCFLAGVCAALVCLLPPRNRRGTAFGVRVLVTAIGAILTAVVISSLHVPSGH